MPVLHSFVKRVHNIEIERFANRSRFLGAIEDGDLPHAGRQGFEERLHREGTVQADFQQSKLFALCIEMVDGFVSDFGARAHHHDHAIGIRRTHVVKQMIGAAHHLRELVHYGLDGLRASLVVRVCPFAHLEKHIGILRGTAQHGMIG